VTAPSLSGTFTLATIVLVLTSALADAHQPSARGPLARADEIIE
jgi:hypothetical protein